MLEIALLIFFLVMAYQVISIVLKESAIFREFGQSRLFALAAILFPVGPFTWLLLPRLQLPFLLGALLVCFCYLPALLLAQGSAKAFDRAGTDRVRRAQEATSKAQLAGFIGVVYIAVVTAYGLAIRGYASYP